MYKDKLSLILNTESFGYGRCGPGTSSANYKDHHKSNSFDLRADKSKQKVKKDSSAFRNGYFGRDKYVAPKKFFSVWQCACVQSQEREVSDQEKHDDVNEHDFELCL